MKEELRKRIEVCAYLMAEAEGFPPGRENDFWVMAEAKVMSELAAEAKKATRSAPRVKGTEPACAAPADAPKPRRTLRAKVATADGGSSAAGTPATATTTKAPAGGRGSRSTKRTPSRGSST
ncbi:DUF2934 domain-containing protein [Phaeovibrio sulfidiphilus]|uniref:DUF2934 domain-containing protein n=1 Tax=Phaeovibrio sulfidiphilus TaxID=1220600 RepID=A0A8J7CQ02_9PROT|nr:DUF2934 domain-containing protein [Phaeovibrio sulfidiphilus]MBE1237682.1 DUF2934 domain-containing protein [Phaeovibrio sulfidiphilus]